ncbi:MAG: orotate phosphoribosyltransferase [Saprospiraceae bacterium]|nr:orotate phosphoribosyltransferase [Saprospiraceae bacterium]
MDTATSLAHKLLQIKAIQLSPQKPFTWASGLRSPIYCDNRIILSHPDLRRFVAEGLAELTRSMQPFEVVAGVATAGIAHGLLLAEALELPFVYVRAKAKEHGRRNMIEGALPEGRRVVVVEDLISTGGSCLAAVEALRDAGAEAAGVAAIFTYGLPDASAAFEAALCPWAALSNYDALIEAAEAAGHVSASELETLREWRQNPRAWSEKYSSLRDERD